MNVRVTDAEGQTLAAGRDLDALRRQLGAEAAEAFTAIDDPSWNRDGLTTWDFDELPVEIDVARGRLAMKAYPALVDAADLRWSAALGFAAAGCPGDAIRPAATVSAGCLARSEDAGRLAAGFGEGAARRGVDPGLRPATAIGRVAGRPCLAGRGRAAPHKSGVRGCARRGPAADRAGGAGSGRRDRAVVRGLSRGPHRTGCRRRSSLVQGDEGPATKASPATWGKLALPANFPSLSGRGARLESEVAICDRRSSRPACAAGGAKMPEHDAVGLVAALPAIFPRDPAFASTP